MTDVSASVPGARELADRVRAALAATVVGSDRVAFGLTIALFTRGHALVEGVPGTGKTLAVRAFALALGLDFRRVQFTPDLMPSDVVGTTVFNPQTAEFGIRRGPAGGHDCPDDQGFDQESREEERESKEGSGRQDGDRACQVVFRGGRKASAPVFSWRMTRRRT